ncbi:LsbB family leaderless bacteriocin [Enterococcus faecium]
MILFNEIAWFKNKHGYYTWEIPRC